MVQIIHERKANQNKSCSLWHTLCYCSTSTECFLSLGSMYVLLQVGFSVFGLYLGLFKSKKGVVLYMMK